MTSTNKKNKRKSYKREEVNEWRLAKRARPGAFTSNTNVICLIECEDDDSEKDHEFFIGTIVKEVDGHVKVHLSGLGRKDDIWLEQDSENLLLDAGATDPPPLSDDDDSENETLSKAASRKDKQQHQQRKRKLA